MEKKIRIGAVSYLNTRPLLYGLKDHPVADRMILCEDYPARVATMLINDEIDVGLVPVAILPQLPEYHLISDFCIGCDGPVASVALFADETIDHLEEILLDYQSRTSVMLMKVLLRDYWKKDLLLSNAGSVLMEGATDVKDLGSGVIGGAECDHFAVRTAEVDWQIWIAQGDAAYPCRYVITNKAVAGWPEYRLDVTAWGAGSEPASFVFVPPAGAKMMDV